MAIGKHVSTMALHGTTMQLQSFVAKAEAAGGGGAGHPRALAARISSHPTSTGRRVPRRLRFAIVQLAIWLFLLAVPLQAEQHKFFDKTNIFLHSTNAASQGFDYWTTERGLSNGAREINPLGQTRRNRIILKSVGFSGGIGLAYILHRNGNHKFERWMPIIIAIPSSIAATYNLRF